MSLPPPQCLDEILDLEETQGGRGKMIVLGKDAGNLKYVGFITNIKLPTWLESVVLMRKTIGK